MHDYRLGLVITSLAVVLVAPTAALAETPTNDLITQASPITAVPFSVQQDTTEANGDGPRICANNGSVFYKFRPAADMRVQVDTLGSDYDTVVTVLRGRLSNLQLVTCDDDAFWPQSAVRFDARAGVRYIIMVGRCCRHGGAGGGALSLSVTEAPTASYAVELTTTSGTIDPISGDIELDGILDCTHRSVIDVSGTVRQRRGDLYIARGWFRFSIRCTGSGSWAAVADVEGNIGFASGDARVRWDYEAWTGFRYFDSYDGAGNSQVVSLT
jgi:hypothetical protein